MVACYIVQFAADQAFLPFEVTSSIDAPIPAGLGGKVANLVVDPLGNYAVQALLLGCACLFLYSRWLRSPCVRAQCCCIDPDPVEDERANLADDVASDAAVNTPPDVEKGQALSTRVPSDCRTLLLV